MLSPRDFWATCAGSYAGYGGGGFGTKEIVLEGAVVAGLKEKLGAEAGGACGN